MGIIDAWHTYPAVECINSRLSVDTVMQAQRGGVWVERGRRALHVMWDASGRNNKGDELKVGANGEECVLTRDNGGPNG